MSEQVLDENKALKEALDSIEEEFYRGAEAMLNHIKEKVTGCSNKNDGCSVCLEGNIFLKRLRKKIDKDKFAPHQHSELGEKV